MKKLTIGKSTGERRVILCSSGAIRTTCLEERERGMVEMITGNRQLQEEEEDGGLGLSEEEERGVRMGFRVKKAIVVFASILAAPNPNPYLSFPFLMLCTYFFHFKYIKKKLKYYF